jgi:outer membrane biosynthesis protein TonB
MHGVFHLSAALVLASSALCLPHDHNHEFSAIGSVGKETSASNTFKKNNLARLDTNTGDVIVDTSVIKVRKLPGGGYPEFERNLAGMKAKLATKAKRHGPDGADEMPSAPTPPPPPPPKTPTSSPKTPPKMPKTPPKMPKTPVHHPPAPKGPSVGEAGDWADTILGVLGLGKGKPSR